MLGFTQPFFHLLDFGARQKEARRVGFTQLVLYNLLFFLPNWLIKKGTIWHCSLGYLTLCIPSNYLKFTLPVPLTILGYFWLKASICWLECALHYNTNYPKLAALRLVIVVVFSLQYARCTGNLLKELNLLYCSRALYSLLSAH